MCYAAVAVVSSGFNLTGWPPVCVVAAIWSYASFSGGSGVKPSYLSILIVISIVIVVNVLFRNNVTVVRSAVFLSSAGSINVLSVNISRSVM